MDQPKLPRNCRVLVVENEPLQALALEFTLEDIGCHPIGPVWQANDIQRTVCREAPNLALVDGNLRHHLIPAVACLNQYRVLFALLAIGTEAHTLDRIAELRECPRVVRPFHAPTVYHAARRLYRQDLAEKIARADQRIAEGQRRLGKQLRLVERMAAHGSDTATAQALAREIARGLRAMRAGRALLLSEIEAVADCPPNDVADAATAMANHGS